MQQTITPQSWWFPAPALLRGLVLAVLLAALAGCAAAGRFRPEPVAAVPAPVGAAGPIVEQLADGRAGFTIRETTSLDAESRRDFERANGLITSQDYTKAITLLEKVVERSPGVTAPYVNLALAYTHTGQSEQAERSLQTALELVPGHPVASNEYGLLLRKAGRFAEARAVYEQALAEFPDYHPVRKNLGILCDLYLRDQACALANYETYSADKPADEQVKIWIADLRIRINHRR
jgi:Tfp pilus assembly protein PilF